MFESYSKPKYSRLHGKALEEDHKVFAQLLLPSGKTDEERKIRYALTRIRNVGIYRMFNSGKYPTMGHYGVLGELDRAYPVIVSTMIRLRYAAKIMHIENNIYAVKRDKWELVTLEPSQLGRIFPKGLPVTEKQFTRWVHYVCHLAQQSARKTCKEHAEGYEAHVATIKAVMTVLETHGVNVRKTSGILKILKG